MEACAAVMTGLGLSIILYVWFKMAAAAWLMREREDAGDDHIGKMASGVPPYG